MSGITNRARKAAARAIARIITGHRSDTLPDAEKVARWAMSASSDEVNDVILSLRGAGIVTVTIEGQDHPVELDPDGVAGSAMLSGVSALHKALANS